MQAFLSDYDKRVIVDSFNNQSENRPDNLYPLNIQVAYYENPKQILLRVEDPDPNEIIAGLGFLMDEKKARRLIEALEQALVKMGNK